MKPEDEGSDPFLCLAVFVAAFLLAVTVSLSLSGA